MRVNLEDSLTDDDHHRFLAKAMGGWDEDRVIGKLYWVYRETQRNGFVVGTIDRAVTLCILRFDSDDECRKFLLSMVTARLAERTETTFRILGNEKHVSRLETYRCSASKGGKTTQSKRSMVSEATAQAIAQPIAQATVKPSLNTPISYLRSPIQEQYREQDLLIPLGAEVSKKKTGSRPRTKEEQVRAKMVKDAFFAGYRGYYNGVECDKWGAPENAHIYHLLKSSTAETLAAKAEAYFQWANQKAISAGHPFMNHPGSFSFNLAEIRADEIKPERRVDAARAAHKLRDADRQIETHDEYAKALANLDAQDQQKLLGGTNGTT